ncbi:hypothetical protein [Pseudomonas sp. KU43P]|uniref:hypothetical protein n=1 Tax=Pseudomonas sp. KU43P TaxID=2487887 RepID=UPI0029530CF3|nr:hypothetical protein [Pseudomonas sp. KU43P]
MRMRSNVYWTWVDPSLHHQRHEETLGEGTCIDVQARLSRTGSTQLFIGVYAWSGMTLYEEAFSARPGESMARALAWGVGRARQLAFEGVSYPKCRCDPSFESSGRKLASVRSDNV